MKMTNQEWKDFFTACCEVLGRSGLTPFESNTWCVWTTFENIGVSYWSNGLPNIEDISDTHIMEGIWSQPFRYEQIAHIIIPREVEWHNPNWKPEDGEKMLFGFKPIDVTSLSKRLNVLGIEHNLSEYCLDIKLF